VPGGAMRIDVQDLGPADRIKFYLQYEANWWEIAGWALVAAIIAVLSVLFISRLRKEN
jgi:hypothetical protein